MFVFWVEPPVGAGWPRSPRLMLSILSSFFLTLPPLSHAFPLLISSPICCRQCVRWFVIVAHVVGPRVCDPYLSRQTLFPRALLFFPVSLSLLLALSWHFSSVGVLVYWAMGASSFAGTSTEVSPLKGTVTGDRRRLRLRLRRSVHPVCLKRLSHANFHYNVFRRFYNHDSHVFVSLKWRLVLLWLLLTILLSCLRSCCAANFHRRCRDILGCSSRFESTFFHHRYHIFTDDTKASIVDLTTVPAVKSSGPAPRRGRGRQMYQCQPRYPILPRPSIVFHIHTMYVMSSNRFLMDTDQNCVSCRRRSVRQSSWCGSYMSRAPNAVSCGSTSQFCVTMITVIDAQSVLGSCRRCVLLHSESMHSSFLDLYVSVRHAPSHLTQFSVLAVLFCSSPYSITLFPSFNRCFVWDSVALAAEFRPP